MLENERRERVWSAAYEYGLTGTVTRVSDTPLRDRKLIVCAALAGERDRARRYHRERGMPKLWRAEYDEDRDWYDDDSEPDTVSVWDAIVDTV